MSTDVPLSSNVNSSSVYDRATDGTPFADSNGRSVTARAICCSQAGTVTVVQPNGKQKTIDVAAGWNPYACTQVVSRDAGMTITWAA